MNVWHEELLEFHAEHHNGTQVCHLIEARPAVGRWASMRHHVMALGRAGEEGPHARRKGASGSG